MCEKRTLKFFFRSECLDWRGNIKKLTKTVEIPWDTYDPAQLVTGMVISGDFSNFPKPVSTSYATDFMQKYSGFKEFDWSDFHRYFAVESETVNDMMKFVVYDRLGNNMKWVEA